MLRAARFPLWVLLVPFVFPVDGTPAAEPDPVAEAAALRVLRGHTGWLTSVAFSPDGKHVLSASFDQTVRLWDVKSGAEVRCFKGHRDKVWSVAVSPDGKWAVSGGGDVGGDHTIFLWDIATGKALRHFEGHTSNVMSLAFMPEGKRFLSGGDSTIRLWDVETGKEVRRFPGNAKFVNSVAVSPDGKRALSGAIDIQGKDIAMQLWDLETGKELRRFAPHKGNGNVSGANHVAFSPDGKLALSASSYDGTIRVSSADDGRELRRFDGVNVGCCVFTPDSGRVLSASHSENLVRLWDIETGKDVLRLKGHTNRVNGVAISPDGRLAASCGPDHTVRLWRLP